MKRSLWARRQLKRMLDLEGDVLDLLAVHDAAAELALESPLAAHRARRSRAIEKTLRGRHNVKMPDTAGFVYVVRSAAGKHKIGHALNVETRVKTLQTGSHEPLKLILSVKTTNRGVLEKICHRRFAGKRLSGEWFDLTPDDLKWLRNLPLM